MMQLIDNHYLLQENHDGRTQDNMVGSIQLQNKIWHGTVGNPHI